MLTPKTIGYLLGVILLIFPGVEAMVKGSESPFIFKAQLDREDALYYKGEVISIQVKIANDSSQPQRISGRYDVIDYKERIIEKKERQIEIPSEDTFVDKLSFNIGKSGVFKVTFIYKTDVGIEGIYDLIIFGVLPQSSANEEVDVGEDSPFGVHTRLHKNYNSTRHLGVARKTGMKWIRLSDFDLSTWWAVVEPEKGKFQFDDEGINLAKEYGMNILGMLKHTPYWASNVPEGTPKDEWYTHGKATARDINDWQRYVTAVVSHFKDRIKYWEVWNEADIGSFWVGSPEDYAEYIKVAYQAAKKADPDCVIMAGGALAPERKLWLEKVFQAGALNYMDVLSFHYPPFYGCDLPSDSVPIIPDFAAYIKFFRDLMEKYGTVKPMWNTEDTVFGRTFYNREEFSPEELRHPWAKESPVAAASKIVKLYACNLAMQVQKVFYFYLDGAPSEKTRSHYYQALWEGDGAPTSRLMGYRTLTYLLNGAKITGQVALKDGLFCYVFEKKDGCVAILWSELDGKANLKISNSPGGFRLIDIMCNEIPIDQEGNTLTLQMESEPIFVTTDMNAKKLISILSAAVYYVN